MKNSSFLKKFVAFSVLSAFLLNMLMPGSVLSQEIATPSNLILPSVAFQPTTLKGIIIDAQNPFRMEFIVDPGDFNDSQNNDNSIAEDDTHHSLFSEEAQDIKTTSTRLIKYFLAALTTPEEEMWVNLSPYEKDRIVDEAFGETTMGRDLLAQDFMLKQLTASLLHPDTKTGKEFWQEIYSKAYEQFGTTDIPFDTFNKVWISPDSAHIYTNGNKAYILSCRMKVQLEEDFLAMTKIKSQQQDEQAPFKDSSKFLSSDIHKKIMREIIIPVIEKEVNEGENFAQLRQIYHSLILSAWFKRKMQKTLLAQAYANQRKVDGLHYIDEQGYDANFALQFQELNGLTSSLETPEEIWSSYVETFKKGVYNFIREEKDLLNESTLMPRKYFSGGFTASTREIDAAMRFDSNPNILPSKSHEILIDAAMETLQYADPQDYHLPKDPNYQRTLRELGEFLKTLPIEKGSALDLGAGTGEVTRQLVRAELDVIALDYNENMLAALIQNIPSQQVTPLKGDLLNIAQSLSSIERSGSFPIITIGYVLHTFSQEEKEWILKQTFDLLDKDGHLVILLRPIDEISVPFAEREHVPNDYMHILEQVGFHNIQIDHPAPFNIMITAQSKSDAAQADLSSTDKALAINDSRWLKRGRPNQARMEIFKNVLDFSTLKKEDSLALANTLSRMTPEMGEQLIKWGVLTPEEIDDILIHDIRILETELKKHTMNIAQSLSTLTHDYDNYFQKKHIPLSPKRRMILLSRLIPIKEIDRIINLGVPEYIIFEILDSKPSLLLYAEEAINFVERHREKMNGDAFAWRFLLMTDFFSAEKEFLTAQALVEKYATLFQNSKRSNDSGKNAAWRFIADNGLNAFQKYVSKQAEKPINNASEKLTSTSDTLGGIDMNPQALNIQEQLGPASPEEIISTTAISQASFQIQGLAPVILNIYPIKDMQKLLQ